MTTNEISKRRAKGGYARAARLSQDQRSAIASEAAKIRWKDHRLPDVPRVLEGFKSELHLVGVTIPCAVISGPKGVQRVLTENGITYAILGERSGASKRLKKAASEGGALLPLFLAPSQLKPFISKELEDGPVKPIDYQDGDRIVRGYDAAVLVVVCNIWLSARQAGAPQAQQLPKAQKEDEASPRRCMDRHMLEEYLAIAEMDVTTGDAHLLVQRRLVGDLCRDGHDTTDSEKFLAQLEALQVRHLEHRDRLRLELSSLHP